MIDSSGTQRFANSVHNGIDIQIMNLEHYMITWGDLRDALKGLAKECRVHLCKFEFSVVNGVRIGGGRISKASSLVAET